MANTDLYSQNWCDLLFEGRNQKYGAYQLRTETGKRNFKSLVILIIFLAVVAIIPLIVTAVKNATADQNITTVTTLAKLEEAKVKDKNIIKEVKPQQTEVQRIKSSIKFTAPVIKKDEEVSEEDELKSQKELGNTKIAISVADVKGNDEVHGKDIADLKTVITSKSDDSNVFEYVEQMPQFPGGEAALLKYISKNIKYPAIALEEGIQGKVMLRFVVMGNGMVGEVQLLKSLDSSCDREAIRVVKSLPKFIPGRQQGKPVSVWYTLPITFEIN